MTTVFEGKVRRVGNSLAVIIPKEILDEAGAGEGEDIKVSILSKQAQRKKGETIERIAGIHHDTKPFVRDRSDRLS